MSSSENGRRDSGGRWFGVGRAFGSDARAAGASAAREAVRGDDAKLMIVFASDSLDLEQMVAGIREQAPEVPLVGCSTAGEISTGGPDDQSLVVTALGGGGFAVETALARGASKRLREAGAEAAECVAATEAREHRVLLMLTDGLAGDQQEIVRGAYGVIGAAVPMVGGCAGDELRMRSTRQIYDDEVMTDAVVAASIASDGAFGIGVRHGWRRVGDPLLVTESDENQVITIDGDPALDVYLERLDAPADAATDEAAFTWFAQRHPLGLASRRGEEHVRYVSGADFGRRSLTCVAAVPQGAIAWLMEGDDASVLDATDAACEEALDPLGDERPLGMLAFDCIARRAVLGEDGIRTEIDRVAAKGQGAPVAGFYTYGEIARTSGISAFHNQTLVVLAVG